MSQMITRYVHPPIPYRGEDWCAFYEGEEESGHYGWGETEAEAIADLKRLDEERAEAEEPDDWVEAALDALNMRFHEEFGP